MSMVTVSDLQSPGDLPTLDGLTAVTNGILPQMSLADRMAHFGEDAYDLRDSSHLMRFMSALLGDAGAGQLRKRLLQTRIQSTLQGSHFFDLDRFYGALFNVRRRTAEQILVDPTQPLTPAQMADVQSKDASYRSRIFQFGRAIGYGASPIGMQLVAEALLNVPCDIFESYLYADNTYQTYGAIATAYSTYGGVEGRSYASLEGEGNLSQIGGPNRVQFIVQPHRTITAEERYDVLRVLSKLKPANSLVTVNSDGVDVHTPVTLGSLAASSEHWEVTQNTQTRQVGSITLYTNVTGTATAPPKPPFAGHQGDIWTYNNDVTGVLAYSLDTFSAALPGRNDERIYFGDGTYHDYDSSKGLMSAWQWQLGRYSMDGVFTITPDAGRGTVTGKYMKPDGTFETVIGGANLCTVYADGMPVQTIADVLGSSGGLGSTLLSEEEQQERFWSTQARAMNDPTQEVYEVRYPSQKSINRIAFDLPHFPHTAVVEYMNIDTGQWTYIQTFTVIDSVPAMFPTDDSYWSNNHSHPHHFGDNHWIPYEINLGDTPVKTDRVRFRLTRANGVPPTNTPVTNYYSYTSHQLNPAYVPTNPWVLSPAYGYDNGATGYILTPDSVANGSLNFVSWQNAFIDTTSYGAYTTPAAPVPYQLGIRRVDLGYRITAKDMLPTIVNVNTEISRSTDIFGSVVTFGVHEEKASGLLQNPPQSWRCEPQIASNAVVNFFADTRDVTGAAQLIDRFYVEPTHMGVHATIYYSNDTPTGRYSAVDDLLPNGIVVFNGNVVPGSSGLAFDPADSSYVTVSNAAIQLSPTQDWWASTSFKALVPSSTPTSVFDMGAAKVTIAADMIVLTGASGDIVSIPQGIAVNQEVKITAGYLSAATADYTAGLVLIVQVGSAAPQVAQHAVTGPVGAQPALLALGASLGGSPGVAGYVLHSFILKQETLTPADATAYQNDPSGYTTKGPYRGNDDGTSDNAILRFDPSFISTDHPAGLVGGPLSAWDDLTWTPILRNFTMQKGYISIPPTKAKFFKFEMTNLVPEIYETYVPVTRQTLFFPTEIVPSNTGSATSQGSLPSGVLALQGALSGQVETYNDSTVPVTVAADVRAALATETIVATDPYVNDKLSATNYVYGYHDWHQGISAPSFQTISKHNYQEVELPHTDKIAYWCGFNAFKAFRLSFLANDDTDVYVEHFNDEANIASNTWQQNPQDLSTALLTVPVAATSKVLASTHNVTGVQFATQQTAPLQLVPDDDFRDPANIGYAFTDSSRWHVVGDAVLSYQPSIHSVLVLRNVSVPPNPNPAPTAANRVVHPQVSPVFEFLYPSSPAVVAAQNATGGIASPLLGLSSQGRVYVAARLTLNTDITNPLQLQLINGTDGTTVLTSIPITGVAGQTIETYGFYDIGSISSNTVPVFAQLIQVGGSTDSYTLDTLSVFDPGIYWEFSNNGGQTFYPATAIRNNANAILTFPERGNQLVWRCTGLRQNMHVTSLRIRPLYEGQISARPSGPMHGPNISVYDTYPQIEDDPEFNDWTLPVPRYWFSAYKNYPALFPDGVPIVTQYARFYGRPTSDTITTSTDSVVRLYTAGRTTIERLDISSPVVDSASRGGSIFHRTGSETITPIPDAASGSKFTLPAKTNVVNRQVHRIG